MAKITQYIICVLMLASCAQNPRIEEGKFDIEISYNPFIKIDFETKTLKISYHDLKYTDTLRFSNSENKEIMESFENSGIIKTKGQVVYADGFMTMPPSDLKIRVFSFGKLQSEITIDNKKKKYQYFPFGEEYKILNFRDVLLKVFSNNKEFKKALRVFLIYQAEHKSVLR